MRSQRGPAISFALAALWLILAGSRAATMIGSPARWVDVLLIFVCGMLVGVNLMQARIARRRAETPPPEILGGPPNVPQ
jgi:hypothetical protein